MNKEQEIKLTDKHVEVVEIACKICRQMRSEAYKEYTENVINHLKKCLPDDGIHCQHEVGMRSIKASLSQKLGVATKNAKSHIILTSAELMSKASDLDMSNREAIAVFKYATGHSIATPCLKGMFTRNDSIQSKSLYFFDKNYVESVHNHRLVQELKLMSAEFEKRKPKNANTEEAKERIKDASEFRKNNCK